MQDEELGRLTNAMAKSLISQTGGRPRAATVSRGPGRPSVSHRTSRIGSAVGSDEEESLDGPPSPSSASSVSEAKDPALASAKVLVRKLGVLRKSLGVEQKARNLADQRSKEMAERLEASETELKKRRKETEDAKADNLLMAAKLNKLAAATQGVILGAAEIEQLRKGDLDRVMSQDPTQEVRRLAIELYNLRLSFQKLLDSAANDKRLLGSEKEKLKKVLKSHGDELNIAKTKSTKYKFKCQELMQELADTKEECESKVKRTVREAEAAQQLAEQRQMALDVRNQTIDALEAKLATLEGELQVTASTAVFMKARLDLLELPIRRWFVYKLRAVESQDSGKVTIHTEEGEPLSSSSSSESLTKVTNFDVPEEEWVQAQLMIKKLVTTNEVTVVVKSPDLAWDLYISPARIQVREIGAASLKRSGSETSLSFTGPASLTSTTGFGTLASSLQSESEVSAGEALVGLEEGSLWSLEFGVDSMGFPHKPLTLRCPREQQDEFVKALSALQNPDNQQLEL